MRRPSGPGEAGLDEEGAHRRDDAVLVGVGQLGRAGQREASGEEAVTDSATHEGRRQERRLVVQRPPQRARPDAEPVEVVEDRRCARVSAMTAFFDRGALIEYSTTEKIFTTPSHERTEAYITGRFG